MDVGTAVAVVAAGPQLPLAAEPHQQPRRLVEPVPHQPVRRLVEQLLHRPQVRRPVERVPHRRQPELRRPMERRRPLAAVPGVALPVVAEVVVGVVAATSRALHWRMVSSLRISARWLAIRTVCRRCSSGRRI